ncbi:hypothetical protein JYT35_00175 [Acidimicrobium ferrooxidans]|uniref:GH15-like domain-containing protein n=1 Tax=Acidimicrobium ferrooxidans TaxID=53635 RepID=A0ABS3ANW0_9ACTN|nr:hypothetical protein [Acidimicrobium ferrooxidans]
MTLPITQTGTVRQRSLDLLRDNQHSSGAFPAALGYSVYKYCWFRDGSFIADALSRVGERDRSTRFHMWCVRVVGQQTDRVEDLVRRAKAGEQIPGTQMLPTRYQLDGSEGNEDWWDYQLDGYGTWMWVLAQHIKRHDLDSSPFLPAIETIANYLGTFGDQPCFDWWEESEEERHLSTVTAVIAGLEAAASVLDSPTANLATAASARLRELVNTASNATSYLPKQVGSIAVDGSLISAAVPFEVIDPGSERAEATYKQIVSDLLAEGVYRYRGDTFYGGGEWIILTAWLGLYEAATGRLNEAVSRRDWIVAQAKPNGDLPEQVAGNAQAPDRIEEWEQRWGPVATPLLWSHAMFLTLDDALQKCEVWP